MGDGQAHGIRVEGGYSPPMGETNQTNIEYIGPAGPTYSAHLVRVGALYNAEWDYFTLEIGAAFSLTQFIANNQRGSAAEDEPTEMGFAIVASALWKPFQKYVGLGVRLDFDNQWLDGKWDVNAPMLYEFENDHLGTISPMGMVRLYLDPLGVPVQISVAAGYAFRTNDVDIPGPDAASSNLQGIFADHPIVMFFVGGTICFSNCGTTP